MPTPTVASMFAQAMARACQESTDEDCTRHVYARLAVVSDGSTYGLPTIVGFGVSDWTDDATVASWSRGQRLDR